MANTVYTKFKEKLLKGEINFLTDSIKLACVDGATYTPNFATNEFLSDIPAIEIVATSNPLQNPTVTNGVFDADDVNLTTVSGDTFEYIIIYKDTGSSATSPLLLCFDTGTGLPFTPSGGGIIIGFSASGIYALT